MRQAKVGDYWRKVYNRMYPNTFLEFDLNGLNSIGKFDVPEGIFAICGLNGAGKSTIISAIKDVIGIPLSEYDMHRLGDAQVYGVFNKAGTQLHCCNSERQRLVDNDWDVGNISYLDCARNTAIQDYWIMQPDINELLDQFEEYEFSTDEIRELNNIIGKNYDYCGVRMCDDMDTSGSIPYFKVSLSEITYDSRGMGSGEHFLFYLYWSMKCLEKGSILIVEEPETYVSIFSQERLLNYMAKQIAEKGLSVIVTTHSPYILKHIKDENIRMVSRMKNVVNVSTPNGSYSVDRVLGVEPSNKGIFFVEDRVAADFLSICLEDCAPSILREYTIESVGGEGEISSRLAFPYSEKIKYNFVGVYDGDIRTKLATGGLNWKYCFLPGEDPIEIVFQKYAEQVSGVDALSAILQIEKDVLFTYIVSLEGTDYHDWFEEFRKLLGMDGKSLVRAFYIGMKDAYIDVDTFIAELRQCI